MAAEAECRHNDDVHPSGGGAVRYRIPGCTGDCHMCRLRSGGKAQRSASHTQLGFLTLLGGFDAEYTLSGAHFLNLLASYPVARYHLGRM